MEDFTFPTTAGEIARALGAPLLGDSAAEVRGLGSLKEAKVGTLTFLANPKYSDYLMGATGAVLLTEKGLVKEGLPLTYIIVDNPQLVFAGIARRFSTQWHFQEVSPKAEIHPSAKLGKGVSVGPFSVIGPGAVLGDGVHVASNVYIGAGVHVGEGCELHPHVVLREAVILGRRVKVFANSVIGSDGFGLIPSGTGMAPSEMPQIGTVVIEDDVRIGALCTVDRATLGETRIGSGCKLDDHVHIGHNAQLGKNVILCGCTALGGSVVIEDDVLMGGQVGVSQGVRIAKGVRVGAQTLVVADILTQGNYFLSPALPLNHGLRAWNYFKKLPEIWQRLKVLEEKVGRNADA